jgi:large subunit ribosomal protein L10
LDNPRPEKVAVVDEVRKHFEDSDAAILTEYRGLKVKDLAGLRRTLRSNGGEYKIFKNTLVRLAAKQSGLEQLESLLEGPVGITFVSGDAAAVAKSLREYSRTNPLLVIKGGVLGDKVIGARETAALADLPSRELLLARLAGAMAAPMQQLAGLMQALPRNLAYGLAALRDKKAAEGGDTATPAADEPTQAAAETAAPDAETAASDAGATAPDTEAATAETETAAPAGEAEAPAAEAEAPAEADAETDSSATTVDEPAATAGGEETLNESETQE